MKQNKYRQAENFIIQILKNPSWSRVDINWLAIDEIKELIDKETPMKPKYREKYPSASCAKCGSNLGDNPRCRNCGQLIDWSDEE